MSHMSLEAWKEMALAHVRKEQMLQEVEQHASSQLHALVVQAFEHQDPTRHWHAYEDLKKSMRQFVGWKASNPEIATSGHYDVMIGYICWMLDQAERSVQITGPIVEGSAHHPPAGLTAQEKEQYAAERCYNWLLEIVGSLKKKTFEDCDPSVAPELYERLRDCASSEASLYNMTITGNVGPHITHMLAAACNQLRASGVDCRYMTGKGLFVAEQRTKTTEFFNLIHEASQTPLLVIDRVDNVSIPDDPEREHQISLFYQILDAREMKGLPTILTAAGPDIVPFIGGASFSRMHVGGVFIEVK